MEFTLICPNDGRIELGLEDVSAVVFHGSDSVEVVFDCPHCHTSLRTEVRVPNLLGAAMELAQYAEDMAEEDPTPLTRRPLFDDVEADSAAVDVLLREERDQRERDGEPYCEYFRRQLDRVECVEDLLAEFE